LDVRPGDTIRLRLDGEVKLEPLTLTKNHLADLTIRADPGFHPVLEMNPTEEGSAGALFDINNARLQLEGLEVRLQSWRDGADWRALVSFVGDGECVLKSCVVTLEGSNHHLDLAALTEKRTKRGAHAPRLVLENCFIRGKGDLIAMSDAQTADVTINNSLIALNGCLFNARSEKDQELPDTAGLVSLRMRKVTTYLSDYLIRMRAGRNAKSLLRTRCDAADCLFLPAGDQALVRLVGPEGEEHSLRDKFSWESSGKNAYGSFPTLLEQHSIGTMMKMPSPYKLDAWKKEISGETNSEYEVKLPRPPAADTPFTQLLPSAFRPADSLKDYGVDISALRALPALRGKQVVSDTGVDSTGENPE
jgi:hypothetical protein